MSMTNRELSNKAEQATAAANRAMLGARSCCTDKDLRNGMQYAEFILSTVRQWKQYDAITSDTDKLEQLACLMAALEKDSSL